MQGLLNQKENLSRLLSKAGCSEWRKTSPTATLKGSVSEYGCAEAAVCIARQE